MNPEPIALAISEIAKLVSELGPVKLMHLCGSHEHALNQHGLRGLLPAGLKVVPGPGCPVCVCPSEAIDEAICLAQTPGITLLTFGDMLRVPGSRQSLAQAKAAGAQVRLLYSPFDALKLAQDQPEHQFVFFAVGFETTMAGVAGLIQRRPPANLSFLMAGRYMPPVLRLLLEVHDRSIQGFLLPGHACIITGLAPYAFMAEEFHLPAAAAGFEPFDVLWGILLLLRQIKAGQAQVENAYPRAVRAEGNLVAQAMMQEVFTLKPGVWRGIDRIEASAFELSPAFAAWDAKARFAPQPGFAPQGHPPGCQCHRIMLGELVPTDCRHFGPSCNPQNPIGPCMVSDEGTCASWHRFGVNAL